MASERRLVLETTATSAPVGNVRVLVVEDEPTISQVCERVLGRKGYAVTLVCDGQAAQSLLLTESFDICLIDIRTPRMSGEQLFEWISVNRPELTGGIILTTGDTISSDTAKFLAAAGRPTLPKPFAPADLLEIVESVTAGWNYATNQS